MSKRNLVGIGGSAGGLPALLALLQGPHRGAVAGGMGRSRVGHGVGRRVGQETNDRSILQGSRRPRTTSPVFF